jgi:4-diphosphocytidyl-2-C-methyl-D-erythritol kinase
MTRGRPKRIRIHAPAKINLTLRVLGVRPDGYHELQTTFQSLALHDTLTFTPARGPLRIECDDPRCPTDRANLVWRAADAMWRAHGRRSEVSGIHVRIEKRIPMEAGLGGGSSDAAAAVRALRAFWGVGLSEARLQSIARDLGADVAFFLEGGTVLGVQRGDRLMPQVDARPAWVVLVLPGFGVSTADAYRWWDESHSGARGRASGRRRGQCGNDLQVPVAARHPAIARAVNRLRRLGARDAAMSGSGSAVFGLFDGEAMARRAAAAFGDSSTSVVVTRTLTRRQHRALLRVRS